jgi:hypothetical protein
MSEMIPSGASKIRQQKRFGFYAAILVVVFLLGLVPMWLTARERGRDRDGLQRELRVTQIENALASAAILARRGDYEPAREAASRFYTNLGAEVDRVDSAYPEGQREMLRPRLAERDDLITLLARSDPASAERLADLYVSYRQSLAN